MRSSCYGEFSYNNPARRRDAIRRVKKAYEQSDRGKRIRLYNYEAKASFILGCKAQFGCLYKDEDNPELLFFHHVNPDEKKFDIGLANASRSWESIIAEMAKCEILCFKHHKEAHCGHWGDYVTRRMDADDT